jgi:hypothetical protein
MSKSIKSKCCNLYVHKQLINPHNFKCHFNNMKLKVFCTSRQDNKQQFVGFDHWIIMMEMIYYIISDILSWISDNECFVMIAKWTKIKLSKLMSGFEVPKGTNFGYYSDDIFF